MKKAATFMIYGENAATFLIFQALARCPGAVEEVFISNLKRFGNGKKKKWGNLGDAQVWLFPNFGKSRGFGEPDAIILIDNHVFWIEVETTVNCRTALPSLRRSLVQLWRFHLLQYALNNGVKNERGFRRIVGKTLTNSREVRPAAIKVGGHGVLKQILNPLQSAGKNENDHYVLFTVDKPKGEGNRGSSYSKVLRNEVEILGKGYPNLSKLPVERCWYAYCKSDLASPFYRFSGRPLLNDEMYIRIRKN